MRLNRAIPYVLILVISVLTIGVKSQTVQGEDECDYRIFTGTVTYADGVPDPFDWECHGSFSDCTEVYIICPAGLQE